MNTDTEVKKLSKNVITACNSIQKEIDRKTHQVAKLMDKAQDAEAQAEILREEISGLKESIAKLQGEQ